MNRCYDANILIACGFVVYLLLLFFYTFIVILICMYGLHRHSLLYAAQKENKPTRISTPLAHITVQVPLYTEENVVERIIMYCCALDWPKDKLEIQILDDSTDGTTRIAQNRVDFYLSKGFDIKLIHRENRVGYKAGALAAGLKQSKGSFIAIFDADFLPAPTFLHEMMHHFYSAKIGLVQARWEHINREENTLTRISSVLLDGHFVIEHTARYNQDCFFNFNGTAGIWRKECIIDAGGWAHDTITEDLDLSYRAQLKGWKFVYCRDITVPAELPATLTAFRNQQNRWAKGSAQTIKKILPSVWKSSIPIRQKIEATFHLGGNIGYPLCVLLVFLVPFGVFVFPQDWAFGALGIFLLLSLLGIVFFYSRSQSLIQRTTSPFLLFAVVALGIGISLSQTIAICSGLFGKDKTFVRTPKTGFVTRHVYQGLKKPLSYVEIPMMLYSLILGIFLIDAQMWIHIPFVLLFAFGFSFVCMLSMWDIYFGTSYTQTKNKEATLHKKKV